MGASFFIPPFPSIPLFILKIFSFPTVSLVHVVMFEELVEGVGVVGEHEAHPLLFTAVGVAEFVGGIVDDMHGWSVLSVGCVHELVGVGLVATEKFAPLDGGAALE